MQRAKLEEDALAECTFAPRLNKHRPKQAAKAPLGFESFLERQARARELSIETRVPDVHPVAPEPVDPYAFRFSSPGRRRRRLRTAQRRRGGPTVARQVPETPPRRTSDATARSRSLSRSGEHSHDAYSDVVDGSADDGSTEELTLDAIAASDWEQGGTANSSATAASHDGDGALNGGHDPAAAASALDAPPAPPASPARSAPHVPPIKGFSAAVNGMGAGDSSPGRAPAASATARSVETSIAPHYPRTRRVHDEVLELERAISSELAQWQAERDGLMTELEAMKSRMDRLKGSSTRSVATTRTVGSDRGGERAAAPIEAGAPATDRLGSSVGSDGLRADLADPEDGGDSNSAGPPTPSHASAGYGGERRARGSSSESGSSASLQRPRTSGPGASASPRSPAARVKTLGRSGATRALAVSPPVQEDAAEDVGGSGFPLDDATRATPDGDDDAGGRPSSNGTTASGGGGGGGEDGGADGADGAAAAAGADGDSRAPARPLEVGEIAPESEPWLRPLSPRSTTFLLEVLEQLPTIKFWKHGRKGWPHRRHVWVAVDAHGKGQHAVCWAPTAHERGAPQMRVRDISSVTYGCSTPVLQRSGDATKGHLYLSLLATKRTLDLQAENAAQRDSLVWLFNVLLRSPDVLLRAQRDTSWFG